MAQLRQPRADPIRAGCQVFAERDRIPHARSDIGVAVLQPLQHGQRQIPVRRRQPRSQPLRQRGPDREDTDAARARALPADGDGRLVVDEAAAVLPADPPALVHLTALAS